MSELDVTINGVRYVPLVPATAGEATAQAKPQAQRLTEARQMFRDMADDTPDEDGDERSLCESIASWITQLIDLKGTTHAD